jgi:hypothetical protein
VPAVRRSLLAVALATPLLLLGACNDDNSSSPKPTPSSAPPTPLQALSTTDLVVRREAFCPVVSPDAVTAALGGAPKRSTSYDNGDPARLATDVKDVAHEYGCTWRSADGAIASAWVFAPPITRARAGDLVRSPLGAHCVRVPGPDFGRPSAATRCRTPDGVERAYRGLFGDAWLSCTLSAPGRKEPADLSTRANRWCAAVATAAAS